MTRERPNRGEGHVDFLGESEGSLPPPHDSLPDAGEARNDFWSMSGNFIYRHHVEPRVKFYSPREESFPIPLKKLTSPELQERIWMLNKNAASTTIGTLMGQEICLILLFEEKPPEGYMWSGERLTKRQATSEMVK